MGGELYKPETCKLKNKTNASTQISQNNLQKKISNTCIYNSCFRNAMAFKRNGCY